MTKRTKVTTIVITLLIIVFGGLFGYRLFIDYMMGQYFAHMQQPAVTVSSTTAKAETWTPALTSVGTLVAEQGVDVSPQLNGQVTAINFTSGSIVQKGDVLVKMDDSVLKQQLAGALAQVKIDQINYNRDVKLLAQNATTQATVDTDQATLQQAQALAGQYQAQINQMTITAPFTGKIGIRQVNIGQYLTAGTAITNLQQLDPIFVDYPLPQQDLSKIEVGQAVNVLVSTYPDKVFSGKIVAIDAEIGQNTRSIMVRAEMSNQDMAHLLLPGMLVTVKTLLPQQDDVITIPQVALNETLYGDTVFLITSKQGKDGKPQLTATLTYVTVGDQQGNTVAISQGLKAGDQVVTFGQVKIHGDSAPVVIDNSAMGG
jgi:RND family efflux transporter MFP subunit